MVRQASPRLRAIIEPLVIGLGYELLGIEFDPKQRILRVYIDHPQGIGVDDCSRVSHQVSGALDVEDPIPGPYSLEISSPGLDRPLFELAHFERCAGALIRCELNQPLDGRRRFKGRLVGIKDDKILLDSDGQVFEIAYSLVERARVVPDYDAMLKGA